MPDAEYNRKRTQVNAMVKPYGAGQGVIMNGGVLALPPPQTPVSPPPKQYQKRVKTGLVDQKNAQRRTGNKIGGKLFEAASADSFGEDCRAQ